MCIAMNEPWSESAVTGSCYNSYLEINLTALRENYRSVKKSLGEVSIIPVLKGDAYGLGAVTVARELLEEDNIKLFAVSQVREALELRAAGITTPIAVLGAVPDGQIPAAVAQNLQLAVFRPEAAELINQAAERFGKTIGIHLKIETGLNRLGAKPGEELAALLEFLRNLEHVRLAGVFTHFIDAEFQNSERALKQLELYRRAVEQIESAGFVIPLKHVCNSGASEWLREGFYDAVRLGRRLYMDNRDTPMKKGTDGAVEEIASWRATVVNVREVAPGETVGYDSVFTASRPAKIADICIGYGDGLCPELVAAKSEALINGRKAPYIGICMDQSFLDVTGIDCQIGDEVTVFGYASDGGYISSQALAGEIGQEGCYFTDLLRHSVERRYIRPTEEKK